MKYGESTFDIVYLLFAIVLGVCILRRDTVGVLMGSAVLVLGCGDAFHLIPRVLNYFIEGDLRADRAPRAAVPSAAKPLVSERRERAVGRHSQHPLCRPRLHRRRVVLSQENGGPPLPFCMAFDHAVLPVLHSGRGRGQSRPDAGNAHAAENRLLYAPRMGFLEVCIRGKADRKSTKRRYVL